MIGFFPLLQTRSAKFRRIMFQLRIHKMFPHQWLGMLLLLFASTCFAQTNANLDAAESTTQDQLSVSWIYGAFIPKGIVIKPLTSEQRYKLFVRQSFTTPGIYIKTAFFSLHDQIENTPPEWGNGFEGFSERVGTRHTQFLLQNSFTSLGDGVLGWEPRYDRCNCSGVWVRSRHAIVRNFVTYDRTEKHLRPQLMPYVASCGAAAITSTWQPANQDQEQECYKNVVTQVWIGSLTNLLGEFAPDILQKLKKRKSDTPPR